MQKYQNDFVTYLLECQSGEAKVWGLLKRMRNYLAGALCGRNLPQAFVVPYRNQKQTRILLCASLGLGLCLAVALTFLLQGQLAFADTCAEIRADTLRLHIRANSNAVADQATKLQVRDAILAEMELIYAEVQPENQASAIGLVLQHMPRLALAASKALTNDGVRQQVNVYLAPRYFGTTEYDTYTLPAGQYTALCVDLGAAKGRNWWCVLYPSICLASASGEYTAPAENEIVCGEYALRFAALEWWQKAVAKIQ